MFSFLKAWMVSFSSVQDDIIFRGVNVLILNAWMLSFLSVEDNIILSVKDVIIFHGTPYMLSF
jgi:hypothetical protein